MIARIVARRSLVLTIWAIASTVVCFLGTGSGGVVRALDALVFLSAGPALGMLLRLSHGSPVTAGWSLGTRLLVACAYSLPVLPLTSLVTLLIWNRVEMGVAFVVVLVLTLVPLYLPAGQSQEVVHGE